MEQPKPRRASVVSNSHLATYENALAESRTHLAAMLLAELEAVNLYAAALMRAQFISAETTAYADLAPIIERVEVAQRQRIAARSWLTAAQSAAERARGRD